jgi:hypothetical protein
MINKRNSSVLKLHVLIIPRHYIINGQEAASSLLEEGLLAPGTIWVITLLVSRRGNNPKSPDVLNISQLAIGRMRQRWKI